MRVFILAGEASGDAYAAALISEIRLLVPESTFEGVGSRLMEESGAVLVRDSSRWGAVGIVESGKVAPRIALDIQVIRKALARGDPGLFIPIDFGFVNIRVCRIAKSLGWKVLYFIPPGSWNRHKQGADLPLLTDQIVTPFSWSAEMLNAAGAKAFCFGHPILQLMDVAPPAVEREGIVVMPGSRAHELRYNLPVIAKALAGSLEKLDFIVSANMKPEDVEKQWLRLAPGRKDTFSSGDKYARLRRAKVGVICSGTATLEAALCDCPTVVLYVISKLSHFQAYVIGLKGKSISLPNILLERKVLPEIARWNVDPHDLKNEVDNLLRDPSKQLVAFQEVRAILGEPHAITRAAELARDMLSSVSNS